VMTGLAIPILLAKLALFLNLWSRIPLLTDTPGELIAEGVPKRSLELAAIFVGAIGMLLVGLWDDKHESRPAGKFICQFAVAALVAASGARITLFVHSTVFSFAITILWILTVINAFNFMDNMNGLCGGLGAIGAFYFGLSAATAPIHQYLVALIAFLACGALVGFLPYNFPRAKSFLGDSGSHLVGYLLAVLAILPHFYTPKSGHTLAVLTPLLILAVPLGDLVWVVLLRWRLGKPFYVGDNNHLSHRLVRLGLSRTRAVLVIWVLALAIGALAFV
jgi:UDP-GlcNAc:undecaprenyl-phosphate/decaprenyl-phosphate GlcNAc-1-phosphate transferase